MIILVILALILIFLTTGVLGLLLAIPAAIALLIMAQFIKSAPKDIGFMDELIKKEIQKLKDDQVI